MNVWEGSEECVIIINNLSLCSSGISSLTFLEVLLPLGKGENDKLWPSLPKGRVARGVIEENDVVTYKNILPEVRVEGSRDGSEKAILVDNIS